MRIWTLLLIGLLVLAAGCVPIRQFAYTPRGPETATVMLPVKLAVLPFKDGTGSHSFNLVKNGIPGTPSALTTDLWARAFADDLAVAGNFRSVRFVYGVSDLVDEEYYIDGTVEKAYSVGSWTSPIEIALELRALRKSDNGLAWEMKVSHPLLWSDPRGRGGGLQGVIEQRYADVNGVMQALFSDARADLLRALAPRSLSPGSAEGLLPGVSSAPPSPESVEQTIDKILKGK